MKFFSFCYGCFQMVTDEKDNPELWLWFLLYFNVSTSFFKQSLVMVPEFQTKFFKILVILILLLLILWNQDWRIVMLIPFSICQCANENGAVLHVLVVLLPRKRIKIYQLHIVILDICSLPMYKKYRKGKFRWQI